MYFPHRLIPKKEKHMDMACVRDQNIRAHIQVHGIMALKCLVFTSGPGNVRLLIYNKSIYSSHLMSLSH